LKLLREGDVDDRSIVMEFLFTYLVPFSAMLFVGVLLFAGALVRQLFRAARLLQRDAASETRAGGESAAESGPDERR
jgi:hypothetical protein